MDAQHNGLVFLSMQLSAATLQQNFFPLQQKWKKKNKTPRTFQFFGNLIASPADAETPGKTKTKQTNL